MNNHGGTRTDTLIKLIMVWLMSLLSFAVGTYVGKQFSDGQKRIAEEQRVILEQKTGSDKIHNEIQEITKELEKVNGR